MIIIKTCSICKESKQLSEYYNQQKKNKNDEMYTYYQPYCKECAKKKTVRWQEDNEEKYREKMHIRAIRRWERPENKVYQRNWAKQQREMGYQKEWQDNNKDKLAEYRESREKHKKHEISHNEWIACKEYFNNTCAYCGLHINNHYVKYSGEYELRDFHKEHVDHNGTNDLSNCVPSCKSCNSRKWKYEFEDWYSEENEIFDKLRYEKILKWLNSDYTIYINN